MTLTPEDQAIENYARSQWWRLVFTLPGCGFILDGPPIVGRELPRLYLALPPPPIPVRGPIAEVTVGRVELSPAEICIVGQRDRWERTAFCRTDRPDHLNALALAYDEHLRAVDLMAHQIARPSAQITIR